ncbi:hypothetical protein SeLEV6574_g08212 [Synchytrium endobioticum]|uniref:Uncharacterized protein n=1 Tax=Synchytrium endobioticum TaxID=286115 RepID=A0A507C215_9FUNG|nr:hypothetical protein SeLEV6574_g08212 [Synchytrium endobioticum]
MRDLADAHTFVVTFLETDEPLHCPELIAHRPGTLRIRRGIASPSPSQIVTNERGRPSLLHRRHIPSRDGPSSSRVADNEDTVSELAVTILQHHEEPVLHDRSAFVNIISLFILSAVALTSYSFTFTTASLVGSGRSGLVGWRAVLRIVGATLPSAIASYAMKKTAIRIVTQLLRPLRVDVSRRTPFEAIASPSAAQLDLEAAEAVVAEGHNLEDAADESSESESEPLIRRSRETRSMLNGDTDSESSYVGRNGLVHGLLTKGRLAEGTPRLDAQQPPPREPSVSLTAG